MERQKKTMYSQSERRIFKAIVSKFTPALGNETLKGNRPEVREDRIKIWTEIQKEYNSIHGVTQRTIQQLKKLFQNMKQEKKQRQNAFPTEGGSAHPVEYPENDSLENGHFLMLPMEGEGTLDSDQNTDALEPFDYKLEDSEETRSSTGSHHSTTMEKAGTTSSPAVPLNQKTGTTSSPAVSPNQNAGTTSSPAVSPSQNAGTPSSPAVSLNQKAGGTSRPLLPLNQKAGTASRFAVLLNQNAGTTSSFAVPLIQNAGTISSSAVSLNQNAGTTSSFAVPLIQNAGTTSGSAVSLNQNVGTSSPRPATSAVPINRLTGIRGSTRKRRLQEAIADLTDARCKRIMQRTQHDSERHAYLTKKLDYEAQLAKVLVEKAEMDLQMTKDRQAFEKKKQEMELEFLETKYQIVLGNLKKANSQSETSLSPS